MSAGRSSVHLHCRFCDGAGDPEAFVEAAVRAGLSVCGFSSHAPIPFAASLMTWPALPAYAAEVRRLGAAHAGRIRVLLGLELDYLPGHSEAAMPHVEALELDYVIGSVHFVDWLEDGSPFPVDRTTEVLDDGLRRVFGGDARRLVRRYYALVREMLARPCPPDVVAHLDKIRRHNVGGRLFSESERWYRDEVVHTLEAVAAAGALLELNTSGRRTSHGSMYPDRWVVEEAKRLGLGVLPTTDAHTPDHVAAGLDEAEATLRAVGLEPARLVPRGDRAPAPPRAPAFTTCIEAACARSASIRGARLQ